MAEFTEIYQINMSMENNTINTILYIKKEILETFQAVATQLRFIEEFTFE
jgi:hypothetical protein